MKYFDLGNALRKYRIEKNETYKSMAERLNMSRTAYYYLEKGITQLPYKRTVEIINDFGFVVPEDEQIPLIHPWYQDKKMRWFVPTTISFFFWYFTLGITEFRNGYGGDKELQNPLVDVVFTCFGAIICVIYWYYLPPRWLFSWKGVGAWFRKMRRARISWFKITYKEEKKDAERNNGVNRKGKLRKEEKKEKELEL